MPNYWVVGAKFSGKHDQAPLFFRRGYWRLGWDDKAQPAMAAKRDQIQPGDRIAIKRLLGQGATEIEIRAIGIVKEIDPDDKRVYVDWVATDLKRKVGMNGCGGSIHGPYAEQDLWVAEIFHI